LWGGAAHNPALALVEMLGKLYNPDNTIAVPGFYDDVVPLTEEERTMIAKTDLSETQYQAVTGVPAICGATRSSRSASALRPPDAGHQRHVERLVWPRPQDDHSAEGRRKAQLAAGGNQDPHKIFTLLKDYLESIAPPTVKLEVSLLTTGKPALIPFDIPEMQAAARAYARAGDTRAVFTRGGGSIPVVADIARLAGDSGGDDGLRAGQRRAAFAQRALQRRDVPARHRDRDRLSGGVGA
jgi:acetylornithine deacetylase/succinyl-diaminopimelate desuccinylase-like protein